MPMGIRKDDKAKQVFLDILGDPSNGNADSNGKIIKRKKKRKNNEYKKKTLEQNASPMGSNKELYY